MKKLISIFSMLVLLYSNVLPAFTYAESGDNELAIQILTNELENVGGLFNNSNTIELTQSNSNLNTFSNGYTVTYNLNGGYWSEDGTTNDKQITYTSNEIGSTNWKTPSKGDTCIEGNNTNMKCMFDGWYYTGLEIKFTGHVTNDIIVYAKWLPFNESNFNINGVELITMDRNLGATKGGTTCSSIDTGACGDHFQWGNNYGFKFNENNESLFLNNEKFTTEQLKDWEGHTSTYYNGIFIYKKSSRMDSAIIGKNTWGGSLQSNSDDLKQGPCPKGYHVPDFGEWAKLKTLMNNTSNGETVKNTLNLPYAGMRDYNYHKVGNINEYGYYFSSTPGNYKDNSKFILFRSNFVNWNCDNFDSDAKSVRCFKNTGKTIKFNSKGGNNIDDWNTKRWRENSATELPNSGTMTRDNSTFEGWYTSEDYLPNTKATTTDIETNTNEDSITLFAKWICDEGYIENPELNKCINDLNITFKPNGGAFSGMNINEVKIYEYQTGENGIKPIYNIQIPNRQSEDMSQQSGWMFDGWYTKSGDNNDWGEEFDISNPNSTIAYAKWLPFNDIEVEVLGKKYVLMDRNLGATTNNKNSTDSYGYYYQWGNNYGFKNDGYPSNSGYDLIINNDQDNNPWGPGNYFYSNKFIKRSSNPYRRDYDNNMNLWGGENQKNIDLDRTGPCPTGYHIPDYNEWYGIRDLINKELTNNPNYCSGELDTLAKCFLSKLNLPFVGRINYWNAAVDSSSSTDYRSSTRGDNSDDGLSHGAMAIDIYGNGVYGYHTYRAFALPIRCFKNTTPINNLTIVKDNGEDDIVYHLRWWEAINSDYKQDDPINKGYRFLGWYSGDNKFSFDGSRYYDSVIVKAKREKRPWYTYDANGGVFGDGTEENIIKFDETEFERKVSHTPNVNDDGTTNGSYPGNYNSIDVLTIEGANILELNVKGLTKCKNGICDYVAVWKGNHPNYDASNYLQYDEDFLGVLSNGQYKSYRFGEEDSFTLGFYSSGNKIDGYVLGYFAELIGLKYTTEEYIATPERKGYTFSGWYESGALEPFDFTGKKINQDRTFYAKWNPHYYTIKFNKNGGTGLVEDINATYGEEINLPIVTREGYTFRGWQSEDGVIYKNIVPEGTGVTAEDGVIVTLTAQWDIMQPSAGGGSTITPSKQETKVTEQEHDSADLEKIEVEEVKSTQTTNTPTINEQVKKVEGKSLTRGEVAVMTNILLEVYPQLTEGKTELDDVTKACTSYADEQNFTKDEKKAITRLCRLSIMGIHKDNNEPLDEFLVKQIATNGEFATVMDRVVANYTEKDLSVVKEALNKLGNGDEGVVFGTVYDVFMSIKNIFN